MAVVPLLGQYPSQAIELPINRRRDASIGRQTVSEQTTPPSAALIVFPVALAGLLGGLAVAYSNDFSAWAVAAGGALLVLCVGLGLWANRCFQAHCNSLQRQLDQPNVHRHS